MKIILVSEIVEKNGKTIRENNLAVQHKIPLKSLVEVNIPYCEYNGIRMFVVEHTRDCDGSPLYRLGPSCSDVDIINDHLDTNIFRNAALLKTLNGFGEESLVVCD